MQTECENGSKDGGCRGHGGPGRQGQEPLGSVGEEGRGQCRREGRASTCGGQCRGGWWPGTAGCGEDRAALLLLLWNERGRSTKAGSNPRHTLQREQGPSPAEGVVLGCGLPAPRGWGPGFPGFRLPAEAEALRLGREPRRGGAPDQHLGHWHPITAHLASSGAEDCPPANPVWIFTGSGRDWVCRAAVSTSKGSGSPRLHHRPRHRGHRVGGFGGLSDPLQTHTAPCSVSRSAVAILTFSAHFLNFIFNCGRIHMT